MDAILKANLNKVITINFRKTFIDIIPEKDVSFSQKFLVFIRDGKDKRVMINKNDVHKIEYLSEIKQYKIISTCEMLSKGKLTDITDKFITILITDKKTLLEYPVTIPIACIGGFKVLDEKYDELLEITSYDTLPTFDED